VSTPARRPVPQSKMSVFERYLSLWVAICMAAGLVLGKAAPGATQALRDMEFGGWTSLRCAM
jgi:ACR3 family arsenite transporter